MPNYGAASYWNKRYRDQAGTNFDWLLSYENFRHIVKDSVLKPKLATLLKKL